MTSVILWISLLLAPSWLNYQGKHFNIHYRGPDRAVIKAVDNKLEENYFRLINIFDVELNGKVDVYIHPDLNSMKNTMNIDDSSEWLVGLAVGDETIHIVSPANPPGNHTFESVLEGLVHEFVHICVASASPRRLPVWLNEGLAVFFSGQHRFAQEVPGLVQDMSNLPSFFTLSDQERFAKRNGYSLSYTIIEMVYKYAGEGGIGRWIREYPDHSALGISSLNELEEMWHRHLEEKYVNPAPLPGWSEFGDNTFEAELAPNPIIDFGDLKFYMPLGGLFNIDVLDPWGNRIQNLVSKRIREGFHGFRIDARNFPPGIYYLELKTTDQRQLIRFTH